MTAKEIVQNDFQVLDVSDTWDKAMNFMDECKLSHYPVVNGGVFIGLVSEEEGYQLEDWTLKIGEAGVKPLELFVEENEHFLLVVQKLQLSNLSCLPVLDTRKSYLGLVTRSRIVEVFGRASMVQDIGSVIEIELAPRDYYLTEISRIIENSGIKILGTYIRDIDNNKIVLTLKLNTQAVEEVISSLERYDYKISASYFLKSNESINQDRYDNLMHFLNL